jgi:DNA polymerase theta
MLKLDININLDIRSVFKELGIPHEVCSAYEQLNMTELYRWQAECLNNTSVLRGNNLVYCAPTSGGKTLVAELVLLKTVISLQKKAIFVLPFVSLVLEKEKHLNKMIYFYNKALADKYSKVRIKAYYGEKGMSKSYRENIIICTIEKANSIFNTLVSRGKANEIGCFILDETHVLGNKLNGYLLEILITKIKLFEFHSNEKKKKERHSTNPELLNSNCEKIMEDEGHIQIIALSATMGNIQELANWFNAHLFITNFRPIPLIERIKAGNNIYCVPSGQVEHALSLSPHGSKFLSSLCVKEDPEGLCYLCDEGLKKGQQIIVFCPSKQQCCQVSDLLCRLMKNISHDLTKYESIMKQRKELIDLLFEPPPSTLTLSGVPISSSVIMQPPTLSKNDTVLKDSLMNGIAYHHSGLSPLEREEIEKGFREGFISILCATTTLATGVNLPTGRVLIRSLMLGKDLLSITHYKQMSGRAGRKGQTDFGESYLVIKPNQLEQALQLVRSSLPNVISQIHPDNDGGNALVKALIDLIGLEICTNPSDILHFISYTLLYQQAKSETEKERLLTIVKSCFAFIIENKIAEMKVIVNEQAIRYNGSVASLLSAINSERQRNEETSLGMTEPRYEIIMTRFGKALLRSGMDPDEAIIFYESLLLAQEQLFLDNSLHLLYLVAPLDGINSSLLPDYKKILQFYEKSKKSNASFHLLLDSIGLSYAILHRWQINPPTKKEIDLSSQIVRLKGISSSVSSSSSSSNTMSVTKDWKVICSCKRIWIALLLQTVLDGYPIEQIAKEYNIEVMEIENLQRNSKIIGFKLEKFCKEMGWISLQHVLKHFKNTLDFEIPKEFKQLLKVPGLSRKVAKVLVENDITTPQDLLSRSVEEIVQYMQLSLGFELQDLNGSDINFELEVNDNLGTEQHVTANVESGNEKKKKSRDEIIRERFTFMINNIMQTARYVIVLNFCLIVFIRYWS